MHTICANCETTQGPFVRKFGGPPTCKEKVVAECNKRRQKLDNERWGKNTREN